MPVIKLVFSSPEAAEEAFYRALQKGDLDLMMAVWDEDENISCVHPAASASKAAPPCVRAGNRSSRTHPAWRYISATSRVTMIRA